MWQPIMFEIPLEVVFMDDNIYYHRAACAKKSNNNLKDQTNDFISRYLNQIEHASDALEKVIAGHKQP